MREHDETAYGDLKLTARIAQVGGHMQPTRQVPEIACARNASVRHIAACRLTFFADVLPVGDHRAA